MRSLSSEQKKRGLQAIELLLGVIDKRISVNDALLIFNGKKRACRVGAGGICQVHGSLISECK